MHKLHEATQKELIRLSRGSAHDAIAELIETVLLPERAKMAAKVETLQVETSAHEISRTQGAIQLIDVLRKEFHTARQR